MRNTVFVRRGNSAAQLLVAGALGFMAGMATSLAIGIVALRMAASRILQTGLAATIVCLLTSIASLIVALRYMAAALEIRRTAGATNSSGATGPPGDRVESPAPAKDSGSAEQRPKPAGQVAATLDSGGRNDFRATRPQPERGGHPMDRGRGPTIADVLPRAERRGKGRPPEKWRSDDRDSYSGNLGNSEYQPDATGMAGDTGATVSPSAIQLTEVWQEYMERGDGRFNDSGLSTHLQAAGIEAKVVSTRAFGDLVLGVDLGDGKVYLLPAFGSAPAAVADWFVPFEGGAARLNRIRRLHEPGVATPGTRGEFTVLKKGVVE